MMHRRTLSREVGEGVGRKGKDPNRRIVGAERKLNGLREVRLMLRGRENQNWEEEA